MNLAELSQKSPSEEEVYQALRRSLQRRKGFGIVFVQCSPATATRLIARVKSDISQKKIAVLSLTEEIDNLYNLVEARPDKDELNILIIQGLEKSLEPYITPGYGGEGDYYTLSNLPPILGHLNQRRDGFLDRFPHLCFVFVLPLFAIKYLIQRSPDFFDWGGGVFEFSDLQEQSIRNLEEPLVENNRPQRRNRLWQILTTPIEQLDFGAPIGNLRSSLWFSQANRLYRAERYEEAITSLDQALKYKPDDNRAWYNRGIALNDLERYEEAITSYDQALKYKPDNHYAWHFRAIALRNLERYEEAIASFDQALKYKPDDHYAWHSRGIALNDLERYEGAIVSFDEALKYKPDDYYAWYFRGIALDNLERYEEAIASYDQALKYKPNYHHAWYSRGNALRNLQRYEEAITSYDQALKYKPDSHRAWNNRGSALRDLQRYEEAITSYDQALKYKPDSHQAWGNRGIALVALERYEEALASYDKVLEIKPDDSYGWYKKACCYGLQGQVELAIANLKQAIDLDPECREMAKTEADFDRVRDDDRFQALIQEQVE